MRILKGLIFTILLYFLSSDIGDIYAMQNEECSEEIAGLQTCIRLKNQKIVLNKDFEIELIFKNISNYPIRIYLVNTEFGPGPHCMDSLSRELSSKSSG